MKIAQTEYLTMSSNTLFTRDITTSSAQMREEVISCLNGNNIYSMATIPPIHWKFKKLFFMDQTFYKGPETKLLKTITQTRRSVFESWPETTMIQEADCIYCLSKCVYCRCQASDEIYNSWGYRDIDHDYYREVAKKSLWRYTAPELFKKVQLDEYRKLEKCPLAYHTVPEVWDLCFKGNSGLADISLKYGESENWTNFCIYLEKAIKDVTPIQKQAGLLSVDHNVNLGIDPKEVITTFMSALKPAFEGGASIKHEFDFGVDGSKIKDAFDNVVKPAVAGYKGPNVNLKGNFGIDAETREFIMKIAASCFVIYAAVKADPFIISAALIIGGVVFAKDQLLNLAKYFEKKDAVEKQGVFDGFSLHQTLGAFVLGDIVKSIDPNSGGLISSFVAKSMFFGRKVSGLSEVIDYFLGLIQKGLDYVSRQITGEDCPFKLINDDMAYAFRLVRSFVDLEASRSSGDIAIDESINIYESKLQEFEELYKRCSKNTSVSRLISPHISNLTSALKDLKAFRNANAGFRIEPVGLFLVGAPGIGKSLVAGIFGQWFALKLASPWMLGEYDRNSDALGSAVFSLNQADQYSSGYRGQPVVFIDEAHPKPVADGVPPLPVRLINLINAAPCPLTMADLGSKGNTFFTSKVILATSNHRSWHELGNVDPGAFYRRAFFVSVVVRPEYAMNPDVAPEKRTLSADSYKLMDSATSDYLDGRLGLEEYIDECYKVLEFKLIDMNATNGNMNHDAAGTCLQPLDLLTLVHHRFENNKLKHDRISGLAKRGVENEIMFRNKRSEAMKAKNLIMDDPLPGDAYTYVVKQGGIFSSEVNSNEVEDAVVTLLPLSECPRHMACSRTPKVEFINNLKKNGHRELKDFTEEDFDAIASRWDGDTRFCSCAIEDGFKHRNTLLYEDIEMLVFGWLSAQHAKTLVEANKKIKKTSFPVMKAIALVAGLGLALKVGSVAIKSMFSAPILTEGEYPFKHKGKKLTKAKVSVVKGSEVHQEGGILKATSDLATTLSKSNQFCFILESPNTSKQTATGNLFLLFNRMVMMPNHLLDEWHNFMCVDPESKITFLGCASEVKGELRVMKQEFWLNAIMEYDESEQKWGPKGGAVVVGNSFKHPEDKNTDLYPDMVIFSAPLAGKDRIDHFISRKDLRPDGILPVGTSGTLTVVSPDASLHVHHGDCRVEGDWRAVHTNPNYDPISLDDGEVHELDVDDLFTDTREWFSKDLMSYNIRTANGNCGSPFFVSISGQVKVASLHVAGRSGSGYAWGAIVFKEDILAAYKVFLANNNNPSVRAVRDKIDPQGSFSKLARAKDADGFNYGHVVLAEVRAPALPAKTKLVHSPLYSPLKDLSVGMAPALLGVTKVNGVLVDPMEMAQKGYGIKSKYPNSITMDIVADSVFASLMESVTPTEMELRTNISTVEAICPGPEWEHLRSMPRKTSPGYPYCLETKSGKTEYFGKGSEYDFKSDKCFDLFAEVSRIEDIMLNDERPMLACMSFLKDERRPIDRVIAGKTRLISAANMAFIIVCRKYTMGFVNFVTRGKIKNSIAVGTNPYSDDWDLIATTHGYYPHESAQKRSDAGDQSGFDKNLSVLIIEKIGDIMDQFYGVEDVRAAKMRRAIITEISMSRHVVGDLLVQWCGSNPSGNPLTAILNSLINLMMSRHSQLQLHLKFNQIPFEVAEVKSTCFMLFNGKRALIATTCYGDDILTTVLSLERKDLGWFGHDNFAAQLLEDFGIVYTDESKGKRGHEDLRALTDCTFLKRGFKLNGKTPATKFKWFAPLDVDTIVESIRWTKEHDKDLEFWTENTREMLEELSLHDGETYQQVGGRVLKALRGSKYFIKVFDGGNLESQEVLRSRTLLRDYVM